MNNEPMTKCRYRWLSWGLLFSLLCVLLPLPSRAQGSGPNDSWRWYLFDTANTPLIVDAVQTLLQDTEGNVWVGTTFGLGRYAPVTQEWQVFSTWNSNLPSNHVTALLQDQGGAIWIGASDGILSCYDPATEQWQIFTPENSPLPSTSVNVLIQASDSTFWVGTFEEGIVHFSLATGQWQIFTTGNSDLPSDYVSALLQATDGTLWAGTDWGLAHLDPATGQWQTFTTEKDGLPGDSINALMQTPDGVLWVGTSSGLVRHNPATSEWQTFTTENSGLVSNHITTLLQEQDGTIWIGTSFWWDESGRASEGGLNHYDPVAQVWQTFTVLNSGLAEPSVSSLSRGTDQSLWIGTWNGLQYLMPGETPQRVALRSLHVTNRATADRRLLPTGGTVGLSDLENDFCIDFTSTDLGSASGNVRCHYRLAGGYFDETWRTTPISATACYSGSSPGRYIFAVRAVDERGLVSQSAMEIVIRPPPFWRKPEFHIYAWRGLLALEVVVSAILGAQLIVRWRRARRLAAWRKGADPYVVGNVIEEPERFYGREEALADVLHALEAGNHIALYGERRIGKTSLLHQLAHRLRGLPHPAVHFLPVFLNLQMVPEPRFFFALTEAVAKAARREAERQKHSLSPLRVGSRPERYDSLDLADDLETVVTALGKAVGQPPRIVLLLDEADKMNGYDPHTQEALRGLLMTPVGNHVKLVWSGQAMNREWHLESSPWYNLFKQELHLGGLDEDAAVRLIRQPVRGVFTYDDTSIQRILELTGRKPYSIQRLCSFCVRRLLAQNRTRVTVDDVEAAWQEMQAEDARRAAEGAADVTTQPARPALAVTEEKAEYHTSREGET